MQNMGIQKFPNLEQFTHMSKNGPLLQPQLLHCRFMYWGLILFQNVEKCVVFKICLPIYGPKMASFGQNMDFCSNMHIHNPVGLGLETKHLIVSCTAARTYQNMPSESS